MEDEVIVRSWHICDKYKRFKVFEFKDTIPKTKPKKRGTKRLKK